MVRLRIADFVLSILGGINVVCGLVLIYLGIYAVTGEMAITRILYGGAVVGVGALLYGFGAALRMLGTIGVAVTKTATRDSERR